VQHTLTQDKWPFQAFSHAERLSLAKKYCEFTMGDTMTRTFECRYTCQGSKAKQGFAQQIGTYKTSLKRTSHMEHGLRKDDLLEAFKYMLFRRGFSVQME
jgi:hypothetical protein